jgi:hypothetical protein
MRDGLFCHEIDHPRVDGLLSDTKPEVNDCLLVLCKEETSMTANSPTRRLNRPFGSPSLPVPEFIGIIGQWTPKNCSTMT